MAYPSTCPDCGALLDHSTTFPGAPDAIHTVSCPECDYAEEFADDPDR